MTSIFEGQPWQNKARSIQNQGPHLGSRHLAPSHFFRNLLPAVGIWARSGREPKEHRWERWQHRAPPNMRALQNVSLERILKLRPSAEADRCCIFRGEIVWVTVEVDITIGIWETAKWIATKGATGHESLAEESSCLPASVCIINGTSTWASVGVIVPAVKVTGHRVAFGLAHDPHVMIHSAPLKVIEKESIEAGGIKAPEMSIMSLYPIWKVDVGSNSNFSAGTLRVSWDNMTFRTVNGTWSANVVAHQMCHRHCGSSGRGLNRLAHKVGISFCSRTSNVTVVVHEIAVLETVGRPSSVCTWRTKAKPKHCSCLLTLRGHLNPLAVIVTSLCVVIIQMEALSLNFLISCHLMLDQWLTLNGARLPNTRCFTDQGRARNAENLQKHGCFTRLELQKWLRTASRLNGQKWVTMPKPPR